MAKQQTQKPAKALEIIRDAKKLADAIKSIGVRAAKLDTEIHVAAVSVSVHAYEHGDITLATKLVDALGKGMRRNALLAWLIKYGPFIASESGKNVAWGGKREIDIDEAMSSPWYDFKKEPEFRPFDLDKMMQTLIERAEKALADTAHAKEHNVSKERIAALKAAMGRELVPAIVKAEEPKQEMPSA